MPKRGQLDPEEFKRTTISLTPKVWEWAKEMMAEGGYGNFSALIADLIRQKMREKEPPPPPAKNHGHGLGSSK